METSIALLHPAGKKAIRMDGQKYEQLQKGILNVLSKKINLTHTEMLHEIKEYFSTSKPSFVGSVEWHMEWVKLDLEARGVIKRESRNGKFIFSLVR
jgi:hypothetical protein